LSVPVQLTVYKDSSPKCVKWVIKLYSLSHSHHKLLGLLQAISINYHQLTKVSYIVN